MNIREFMTKRISPLEGYRRCPEQYLTTEVPPRPIRDLSDDELDDLLIVLQEQKRNANAAFAFSIQATRENDRQAPLDQAVEALFAAVQLIAVVKFELERRAKAIAIVLSS